VTGFLPPAPTCPPWCPGHDAAGLRCHWEPDWTAGGDVFVALHERVAGTVATGADSASVMIVWAEYFDLGTRRRWADVTPVLELVDLPDQIAPQVAARLGAILGSAALLLDGIRKFTLTPGLRGAPDP